MRGQHLHIRRVFEPDLERQTAALALLLRAPTGAHGGSTGGGSPVVQMVTPWWCFSEGGSRIVWSALVPPLGDDQGPFDHVEPFPFDANPVVEWVGDPNDILWPPGLHCEVCGRPFIVAGVLCLCEITNVAA